MSTARKELEEALMVYTTDTLICVDTVLRFCEKVSKWMLGRESELQMMMDIKVRDDAVKGKLIALGAQGQSAELQEELAAVLKDTLAGLETLDRFLEAVERLAVTSLHVFADGEDRALRLPEGICPDHVQVVVGAARQICPLLLEFKRDAGAFFLPRLQNVEALAYQLDQYIRTAQIICDKFEKSTLTEFRLKTTAIEDLVKLDDDFSEDDVQRMLDHINMLGEIRMNQNFRMVFLFQDECGGFISEFSDRQPRMLQFLNVLEGNAVQLDSMNKGAKISSVVGSSVGAVGGVLSIIGLALIPVTAGVSLALTMTGVGLGITSGVNSAVTAFTEIGVNRKHQKQASEVLQSFMEDVQVLQDCLEATKRESSPTDVALGVGKVLFKAGGIAKDATAAVRMLKSEELVASAGRVVVQEGKALRNVPRVASEIPEIGQAAVKSSLALSKSARVGLIAANALFIGMDIFFICKDSISLAHGSETDASQFIRARSELWSSEMDAWQKIHDCLTNGLAAAGKHQAVLETPFYPGKEGADTGETEEGMPFEEQKEMNGCVLQ